MSAQFGPRGGASNNAVSTGVARDPAQLVPVAININYEAELGTVIPLFTPSNNVPSEY